MDLKIFSRRNLLTTCVLLLIWTQSISAQTCGDGKVGGTELCDNGNTTGCLSNCVPDAGFTCTKIAGLASVCTSTCGDQIRASNEACDNGKRPGCATCTSVDTGFTCNGAVGSLSICTSVCGDGLRYGL
jgi:cysteine-rich repeat protein